MTDREKKALVDRLRGPTIIMGDRSKAADQIEADGQRIAELEAIIREITGT